MWSDACGYFEQHRDTLARAGIVLQARLEPDSGILCTYARGVVRLALPDPDVPGGEMRATLLATLLGLTYDEVVWLFRSRLSHLVGHEIGHALRDEAGRMGDDPWVEEQAAERIACVLAREHISSHDRSRLCELVRGPARALGGIPEALATYRLAEVARACPDLATMPTVDPPTHASYRDLLAFTRISVAWAYFDLLLDPKDELDECRQDLLVA